MAVTSVAYDGDAAETDFVITFDYTSRSFVKAYLSGVLTTDWAFLDATTVRFSVAPPAGTGNVELRRETATAPLVDWTGGASITETNLDRNTLQVLHILEEFENNLIVGMIQDGGNWDATNDRITDLADPLAEQDAATKGYVDDLGAATSASAAAAAASAVTASGHAANAAASAGAAAASAVLAAASAVDAEEALDTLTDVYPVAGMSTGQILMAAGAADVDAVTAEVRVLTDSGVVAADDEVIIPLGSSYEEFEIVLGTLLGATDDDELLLQFSVDGGATYRSTAGDYSWALDSHASGATVAPDSSGDTSIRLINNLDNAYSLRSFRLTVTPSNGSVRNTLYWRGAVHVGGNAGHVIGGGSLDAITTRATHLRLFWGSAGNFTVCQYFAYGINR